MLSEHPADGGVVVAGSEDGPPYASSKETDALLVDGQSATPHPQPDAYISHTRENAKSYSANQY